MRSTPGKHEQLRHEHPTSVTTRLMPALASPSSATGQARRRAVATSERVELSNGAAHARKCARSRHVRSRRTRITNACQHAVVDEHHHMISSGDQRQHWKKVFAALPVTSVLGRQACQCRTTPSALPNLPGGHMGHADALAAPDTFPNCPFGLRVNNYKQQTASSSYSSTTSSENMTPNPPLSPSHWAVNRAHSPQLTGCRHSCRWHSELSDWTTSTSNTHVHPQCALERHLRVEFPTCSHKASRCLMSMMMTIYSTGIRAPTWTRLAKRNIGSTWHGAERPSGT